MDYQTNMNKMWKNKVVYYTIPNNITPHIIKKWLSKHLKELNIKDDELWDMTMNIYCKVFCNLDCYMPMKECRDIKNNDFKSFSKIK